MEHRQHPPSRNRSSVECAWAFNGSHEERTAARATVAREVTCYSKRFRHSPFCFVLPVPAVGRWSKSLGSFFPDTADRSFVDAAALPVSAPVKR